MGHEQVPATKRMSEASLLAWDLRSGRGVSVRTRTAGAMRRSVPWSGKGLSVCATEGAMFLTALLFGVSEGKEWCGPDLRIGKLPICVGGQDRNSNQPKPLR